MCLDIYRSSLKKTRINRSKCYDILVLKRCLFLTTVLPLGLCHIHDQNQSYALLLSLSNGWWAKKMKLRISEKVRTHAMQTFKLPLKCLQQIFTPHKLLLLLCWEMDQSYINIQYPLSMSHYQFSKQMHSRTMFFLSKW